MAQGSLQNDARGYESFIFEKDFKKLTKSMDTLRMSLSLQEEFFTTEVRWTDRLFSFSGKYFNSILDEPIPSFNAKFLFSSLTGSIGNFKFLPVFGVQWLTNSKEIAILTETNSSDKFEAQLFHFGNKPRKMGVRFYNLDNGNYHFYLNEKQLPNFEIKENKREIKFVLNSEKLVKLKIEKVN